MKSPIIALLSLSAVNCLGYDYDTAMKAFYYSAAAYCNSDLLTNWKCGEACTNLYGVTTFTKIIDEQWSTFGFVAYNAKDNEIVVSFRGTVDATNWFTDLSFNMVQFPYAQKGVSVHGGFY